MVVQSLISAYTTPPAKHRYTTTLYDDDDDDDNDVLLLALFKRRPLIVISLPLTLAKAIFMLQSTIIVQPLYISLTLMHFSMDSLFFNALNLS